MLLTFGGSLWTGEQWSCGLRSTPNFGDGNEFGQGALEEIVPVLSNWWSTSNTSFGTATLGWAKFNRIGTDGRYVSDETNLHEYTPAVSPGATSGSWPAQISLVATLETGVTRGLACRGRIFLPVPRVTLGPDGRIAVGSATAIATSTAALITSLNALPLYGVTSIYSDVREGRVRSITGVSVGRVLDTVRSRRTSLGEDRPPAVPVGGS